MLTQGARDERIGFKSFKDLKPANSAFIVSICLEDKRRRVAVTRVFWGETQDRKFQLSAFLRLCDGA